MKIKLLSLLFLFVCELVQASAPDFINKRFGFTGFSALHGPYRGQLEFRGSGEELSVIRVMTYDQFSFEGLAVQEVWTGKASLIPATNELLVSYKIKKADFILSAEGASRSTLDFKNNIIVTQKISVHENKIFSLDFSRNDDLFSEQFDGNAELSAFPLWQDQRLRVESKSHETSSLFKLVKDLVELRVFRWFHSQEWPKLYADKDDYKNKRQFFIYDFTDYDFYQRNKDVLRVVNKVPDQISLIESLLRRNAYAFTLKEKMEHYEADMREFHLNEFGLFSGAVLDTDGKFVEYSMDGDGALWTGMYLASQAMRFKVTNDPDALSNIKKSLSGLMLLMDITESKKQFARNVGKYKEGGLIDRNLHRGEKHHQDKVWLSSGNNDMFKGLIHGFIWAYLTLPESEVKLRENLMAHMSRLTDLDVAEKIQNRAPAFGLRALATRDPEDVQAFRNAFLKENRLEALFNIEGNMHMGGIVDWSGANLGMVSVITDLLIARALGENDLYEITKKDLALSWKDLAQTKRDFLTIATYAFSIKDGFNIKNANEIGDGYSRKELEEVWQKDLSLSLTSLKEIPIIRSQFNITYDYSLRPDWCLSWWPRLPWKSVVKRGLPEYHYQGVDSYPLFEGLGLGSNFIWKDQAFGYIGGSYKFNKSAGADYLYSYWMGRLAGLISSDL